MKVSKNSQYQTHEKPKRRNWRARCAERGILSHFLTSIVAKYQKIEGLKKFGEKKFPKSLTMPKKTRGDFLGFFNIHSVAKHQKIEGGPFGENLGNNAEKTERGDSLVSPRMGEKRGKTFLVQFARPNDAIWDHKIL